MLAQTFVTQVWTVGSHLSRLKLPEALVLSMALATIKLIK